MLNSHRAVLNNIDQIVSAAYRQGQSDGQRGLVDRAANVSAVTQNTGQPNGLPFQISSNKFLWAAEVQ